MNNGINVIGEIEVSVWIIESPWSKKLFKYFPLIFRGENLFIDKEDRSLFLNDTD